MSEHTERRRIRLVTGGILLALALVVVALRLFRLDEIPLGLIPDSGIHGVDALRVLKGEHAVVFPAYTPREGMFVYGVALSTAILGRTMLALRLPAALASAGSVFVVLWLGQLLFGRDERTGRASPWRGLLIGGVGAGLLAVSLAHTAIGRTAYRANLLPLVLCLCLALFWRGWSQRSWRDIVLAGVCAGLLPYTYIAARFTPFLFLFLGLSFLLPPGASAKERVRAELPRAAVFLGVTGLVAAPILIYFALHPDHFFMRSNMVSILQPGRGPMATLVAFLDNVWDHLLAFGFRGNDYWRFNVPGRPLLNPFEAIFFWLGIGMAMRRWQRRPAYRLLLLWLGVLMLPAMLSRDDYVPHFMRMMGATPAVYLLTGVGVWEAFRFLRERYFRQSGIKSAVVLATVASGLILAQAVSTYRTYFDNWAASPEMNVTYDVGWTKLAQALNQQPYDADMVYLIPRKRHGGHPGFDYLYHGAAPLHVIYADLPSLAQKIESTLAPMENLSTVTVVDWNPDAPWAGSGYQNITALLDKYGRYLGRDEYGTFRFHVYSDVALDRPWTSYQYLEPLTVVYDGGISLHGFALGQSENQLSTQQQVNLGKERAIWLALQWQAAPGLEIDYRISVRLYDAEDVRVFQDDVTLVDINHEMTSQWKTGEPVDNLFYFEFPTDLPPGEYELRLVVYDSVTRKPAAELDVWYTEITLARLRLAEDQ